MQQNDLIAESVDFFCPLFYLLLEFENLLPEIGSHFRDLLLSLAATLLDLDLIIVDKSFLHVFENVAEELFGITQNDANLIELVLVLFVLEDLPASWSSLAASSHMHLNCAGSQAFVVI